MTLTRQNYATPWGVLPNDRQLTAALIDALGEEAALAEEIHHINEHSIELALVWLHYLVRRVRGKGAFRDVPHVVPVLCGNMVPYVQGERDPDSDETFDALLEVLEERTRERRTLVVAAGDLAHVGPAFGDSRSWDEAARARLRGEDHASLEAMCSGDARGFFRASQEEGDRRRVCGLTPIYLALRLLGGKVTGRQLSYDQCPADAAGESYVSIAGVAWTT